MSSIFISYRRSVSGGHAGRLFDRLGQWYDKAALFYDKHSIDSGEHFPQRLADGVEGAAVVLVLIGSGWLDELRERAARTGEVDFVRAEVAAALRRLATASPPLVLPVLLDGAAMPSARDLPEALRDELAALCPLDAHEQGGSKQADWDQRFERLLQRLRSRADLPVPRYRPPPGHTQPFRLIEQLPSPHFHDPNGLVVRLREQLQQTGRTALVSRAALYGMGGLGKTQLALRHSLERRADYAGVWWFRAETSDTLETDALALCQTLGQPTAPPTAPSQTLRDWLEGQSAPWLLVYDNAERPEDLRALLPRQGPHHILITSRNPAWGGLAAPLELQTWTPAQGADFLAERLGRGALATEPDAAALSADLGGLPLALEQAASYLDATGCSLADYRRRLADVDTADLLLDDGRNATGYERSVLATLTLADERLGPAARRLLRLGAYAAAEPLPERFVIEAADGLPAELAEAARQPLAWDAAVGELLRYGLAQRQRIPSLDRAPGADPAPANDEPALVWHRLTQQAVRARLAQPEQDGPALQGLLSRAAPEDVDDPRHWPRWAALAPHVSDLQRFQGAAWQDRRELAWLLDRAAGYHRFCTALYPQAEALFQAALRINQADLGNEAPNTLALMNNLADLLTVQGDWAGARRLQEPALATTRRLLGDEHTETLISMNNLAATLYWQGDWEGARLLQDTVLAASRRLLGDEHPKTLIRMNNLAATLRQLGRLDGALGLDETVWVTFRRVLGNDHPDTLMSLNNLASSLYALGRWCEARGRFQQAFDGRRRLLGDDHPDTLTTLHNLAVTLWKLGERSEALAMMGRATVGRRDRLGPDHPDTQNSERLLAEMQAALNHPNPSPE